MAGGVDDNGAARIGEVGGAGNHGFQDCVAGRMFHLFDLVVVCLVFLKPQWVAGLYCL